VFRAGGKVADVDKSLLYLRAEFPSNSPKGGIDDVEFRLTQDGERLVFFRSASRTTRFQYPLTEPTTDGGGNAKRLDQIRRDLGWEDLAESQKEFYDPDSEDDVWGQEFLGGSLFK